MLTSKSEKVEGSLPAGNQRSERQLAVLADMAARHAIRVGKEPEASLDTLKSRILPTLKTMLEIDLQELEKQLKIAATPISEPAAHLRMFG